MCWAAVGPRGGVACRSCTRSSRLHTGQLTSCPDALLVVTHSAMHVSRDKGWARPVMEFPEICWHTFLFFLNGILKLEKIWNIEKNQKNQIFQILRFSKNVKMLQIWGIQKSNFRFRDFSRCLFGRGRLVSCRGPLYFSFNFFWKRSEHYFQLISSHEERCPLIQLISLHIWDYGPLTK